MRRFVMQKRANSQDFVEKSEIEKFLIEARKCLRPQSSFRDIDDDSSNFISETSNASFNSPKMSTKATKKDCFESYSRCVPGVLRGAKRIQELVACSFDINDKKVKQIRSKEKIEDFCIKGRPLTAHSEYLGKQNCGFKFKLRKRNSLGCSSDPKTFDDEYTSIEEYTRAILSHSERKTAKNCVIDEKPCEESQEKSEIIPVHPPVIVSTPNSPSKRISLIVSTKLAFRTQAKVVYSTRGKILKGICNKASVPRNKKLFHNILIS